MFVCRRHKSDSIRKPITDLEAAVNSDLENL